MVICKQKACTLCAESRFVKVSHAEIKVSCNTNNVGYRWCSVTREETNTIKVYEVETSRSARLSGAEHLKQHENQTENSVLFKHKMAAHQLSMKRSNLEWRSRTHSKMLSLGKATKLFGFLLDRIKNYSTVNPNLTTHPQPGL